MFAGWKVSIKRTNADTRLPGNLFKRNIRAAFSKGFRRDLDQFGAIALRVST
jgi:hypothetical protein